MTQALLFLGEVETRRSEAAAHATHYEPVPVDDFRALLGKMPPEAIARSTFVDVGAGMGRAMLLAAEYPFKQIVGIEFSAALVALARDNLASQHGLAVRCRDLRLIRADARKRRFPPGDLMVFLYNPFDAEAMEMVLDRIAERSRRGDERLLYHTPVHGATIEARGYERVAELPCGTLYERRRTI